MQQFELRANRMPDPEADVYPIEGVDGTDEQPDVDLLRFAEISLQRLIGRVGRAAVEDVGKGFGRNARTRQVPRIVTSAGE